MKRAIKAITDILSACGCDPGATINTNGDAIIKVNAPPAPVPNPGALPDFNDPWVAFFEPD